MKDKLIKHLVQQLNNNQNGTNWLDEHFKKKITDIEEREAFIKPLPEIHSVAELVWHILIWRTEGIKKLKGGKSGLTMQSPENWRNNIELKEIGWNKLRLDLYKSQDELIELIVNQPDSYLENEYAPGYTYLHLIEGLIHHDIYHLGQIGITVKLLKSLNSVA